MKCPEQISCVALPSIAVIIPVYRVTDYLEEAISSAIQQEYTNKDVIVVDDGSPEESAAEIIRICALFPDVTLLRRPHIGVAAARHAGVLHTSCDAVVFLDGDDVLLPGALAYFSDALLQYPHAVAAYARMRYCDADGNPTSKARPELERMVSNRDVLLRVLTNRCPFCNGSICVRRDALLSLAPNNSHLILGEDWVLWAHLALSGDIVPAGEQVTVHYRTHDKSSSSLALDNYKLLFESYAHVFTDSRFVVAVGEEEIKRLHEVCNSVAHARLAIRYGQLLEREQASYHFFKITVPLEWMD